MNIHPTHPASEPTWLSLHLRCDGDTDEFLRAAVLDTAEDIVARFSGGTWFYLRYWEGGPHVRLRLLLPASAHPVASQAVRDHAASWLVENDPRYEAPQTYYDQIAGQLAAREGQDRTVLPWQPHGRIWEEKYEPEVTKYGIGPSLQAYERHFHDSSALASQALRRRPGQTQVLSLATALILTSWMRPDLGPGLQSYDELVSRWGSSQRLDRRKTPQIRAELLTILMENAGGGNDPWSRPWQGSLDQLLGTLIAEGLPPEQRRNGVDICHHLLCNRLGLTLEQELTVRRNAWAAIAGQTPAPTTTSDLERVQ